MVRRDLSLDSCFFSFLVCLSRSLLAFAALAKNQTSKGFAPVTIETPRHTYEYVGTALDWWQAGRYCEQHFAQLLLEPQDSEQGSLSTLLQSHHIRGSVWLKERDSVLHKAKRRRGHTVPVLVFRDKTDTKYVKVLCDFPALAAVTACAHLQWDTRSQDIATVFSYAVPAFINEFQLRGFVDEEGFVRFALIVHGHHSPYLPVFRADGQWHHFCVTWQQDNGTWAIYADGKRRAAASGLCSVGPSAPQAISGQGTFIIGQDQDSLGGTFRAKESFSGNITDLHIWHKVLSTEHIERARSCWVVEQDLLFGWSSNALEVESTVQTVAMKLLCPGPVEECRVLEVGSSGFSYASCLQPLPFICHYSKDAYWQLKRAQLESSHALARRVNTLAVRTVIPDSVFSGGVQDLNLSVALDALDVLAAVLREGEVPVLEPSDLLAVLQLLKQVSDLEIQEGDELEMLEQLGQYYMEVTELILEEQNSGTWSLISQVIRGPMAVVELCDRMVSLLVPLLTTERTKITIQHGNIGVEVRGLELSEQQLSGEAYVVQTSEKGRHDLIEVPAEEMQRLKSRGLHRVTMKNMWFGYGSLQRCLSSSAVSQATAAPDGAQKFLGTSVGTAVISATLLSDQQEISAAVRYRLQHRAQDLPSTLVGPVCAFWNFSLSPDAGGMWSTAGCSVAKSLPDSTACFCNHTTNFAILLQVYEMERTTKEEFTLQTLTFIGCGVSFCALMVTFILFLAVGVPKSERTTVHKNLILALAAGEALLMVSELAKPSQVLCFMVTAFLHLFFMAAFSWMLVEGLLLWSKVVAVNMSEGRRMRFYYVTGWGLPVLIVGVTLASSFDKYVAANHCWLNVQTNVIWAFVGPVLLILAVNSLVLLRVVTVTVASARRRSRMLTPNSSLESQIGTQLWATAKPVLVLLPVLGLTWLCGLLVHLSIVWAYVFIVLNSLQGLYIFLVYAVCNSEVRNAIQRMKDKKKALSFTNCSHPINYLSSPRNTSSWDTGRLSPAPEAALPSPVQRDPPVKSITSRGNFGARIPMGISSITSPERPVSEKFLVTGLQCRGSSSRKEGRLEELASLGELPARAELPPCAPSQPHVPNQGSVGSHGAWSAPDDCPAPPQGGYLCSGLPTAPAAPARAARAGLDSAATAVPISAGSTGTAGLWLCHHCPCPCPSPCPCPCSCWQHWHCRLVALPSLSLSLSLFLLAALALQGCGSVTAVPVPVPVPVPAGSTGTAGLWLCHCCPCPCPCPCWQHWHCRVVALIAGGAGAEGWGEPSFAQGSCAQAVPTLPW